jgi:hypothetical protein
MMELMVRLAVAVAPFSVMVAMPEVPLKMLTVKLAVPLMPFSAKAAVPLTRVTWAVALMTSALVCCGCSQREHK